MACLVLVTPQVASAQEAAAGTVSTDPQVIARGKALIDEGCLDCHEIGGWGGMAAEGIEGPPLDSVVSRRGAAFVRRKLADPNFNMRYSLMPNFGFTEVEIEAIVAFLATLTNKQPSRRVGNGSV